MGVLPYNLEIGIHWDDSKESRIARGGSDEHRWYFTALTRRSTKNYECAEEAKRTAIAVAKTMLSDALEALKNG